MTFKKSIYKHHLHIPLALFLLKETLLAEM